MFRCPFWLRLAAQSLRRAPRRRPVGRALLRFEALEQRLVPTAPTFTVTNLLDSGTGSLRWAIGKANLAGQGIVDFQSGLNGTISLHSEIQISSNLKVDASAATGNTGPHRIVIIAPISGGRIFDLANGAAPAGVHVSLIADPNGAQSVPTGLTLEGGNHVAMGGAILAPSAQSTITCTGCDLVNNNVTIMGGAIWTEGTLALYNTTIESNSAVSAGGGAWVGGDFFAYNSFITNNKASDGAGGGILDANTGSTLIFSQTTVQSNSAGNLSGGGVWARYNVDSYGSSFSLNTAQDYGGAIFSQNGNVLLTTFSGSSAIPTLISGNSAGRDGGGVFADHSASISGSNVIGNTALGNGGGIFVAGGDVTVDGGHVQNNQALGQFQFGMTPSATGNGGGLYAKGNAIVTGNSQIGGATAAGIAQGNQSLHNGGGINALFVSVTDSVVDGNSSTSGSGGGIWAGIDANLDNAHVDGNSAPNGVGGGIGDSQGDIFITSSDADASANPPTSGSSISGNLATEGGGIWSQCGALVIDSQTLIDSNRASGDGGGIWICGAGSNLRIDTSTVSNNQALHGGGIDANNALSVTLFQARILSNTATAPGSDPAAGGGILLRDVPNASITYSTIASNTATSGNGAGVAAIAKRNAVANLAISDSTFGGLTDPKTGKVTPNSAGGLGGALYARNVVVDIIHATFNDNVAFGAPSNTPTGKGGSAIYADVGAAVTLEDTLVDDTNNLANPLVNPGSSELLDAAFANGILSAGDNLVHDGSWSNVANWNSRNNDIANGNQDLGALKFNQPSPGQPAPTYTETYALVGGAGEQAIGGGDDLGQTLDQNGAPGPWASHPTSGRSSSSPEIHAYCG